VTAMLAFAGACLAVAVSLVAWRVYRTVPAQRAAEAQLRIGRARLTAALARLAADVSTLDPGVDQAARRRLAAAAERLATARTLVEQADTPAETLAAAETLVEGTRAANHARARLGLPKRKLPALRRHRELVRRTREVYREEPPWERRARWAMRMMYWPLGVGYGVLWYYLVTEPISDGPAVLPAPPADPVSLGRYFLAWLPLAAVAVIVLRAVLLAMLSAVRRSEAELDVLGERRAEAEALLARVAARLADPAAAVAPDVEVVATAYVRAVEGLEAARTVGDIRAATEELRNLISAARAAGRTA
jgi:hypothetical protein